MTNSLALNVVVEGITDAAILRAILRRDLLAAMSFYSAQGLTSVITVGRNLLVHEREPVLVIMDSDTLDVHQAEERKATARFALGHVAPGALFEVFVFVPEIEVIFFEAPEALGRALTRPIPKETAHEGLLAPKSTLNKLLSNTNSGATINSLLSAIDPALAKSFCAAGQARELTAAIEQMLQPVSIAS
jgi:hypothetical protein